MDLDYLKVAMYGQFVKTIIVKDTTIDLPTKAELCNYVASLVRVMEELQRNVPNPDNNESVNFLVDWIETSALAAEEDEDE